MKLGPLTLFQRMHSNGKPINSFVVAALHWPWSITWSWGLNYDRAGNKYRQGFYSNGRKGHRSMGFNTLRLGCISFQTQETMRRK